MLQEILLTPQSLPGFAHLIPPEYCSGIETGAIAGVGVIEDGVAAATFLCREEKGNMRILWLSVAPTHWGRRLGQRLLERRLRDAWYAGRLRGAVADVPEEDEEGLVEELLLRLGFSLTMADSDVYVISLGRLKRLSLLSQALSEEAVVPLEKADAFLRRSAAVAVRNGKRAAPLPYPLDWERYDPRLSAFYSVKGQIQGVLLVTQGEERLCLDFAWASAANALRPLLSHAAQKAWAALPPETEVMIPTANEVSAQLARRMLGIRPRRILQGFLPFPGPAAPEPELSQEHLQRMDPMAPLISWEDVSDLNLAEGGV